MAAEYPIMCGAVPRIMDTFVERYSLIHWERVNL